MPKESILTNILKYLAPCVPDEEMELRRDLQYLLQVRQTASGQAERSSYVLCGLQGPGRPGTNVGCLLHRQHVGDGDAYQSVLPPGRRGVLGHRAR